MRELLYVNDEGSFGIEIKKELISAIYKMCKESYPKETGGILIGKYSPNLKLAKVTIVTGAPDDSKSGRTWFQRGTNGLQRLLDDVWETQGAFYLGEWHYHPGGAPTPSTHDIAEMDKISKNITYNCPEPILLIVGSTLSNDWNLGAYVFVGIEKYVLLEPLDKK